MPSGKIESLMPSSDGKRGNRFRDHRTIVEGVVYRFRTGIAWRDLPERFGPWQTVWKPTPPVLRGRHVGPDPHRAADPADAAARAG
jgi:transposase